MTTFFIIGGVGVALVLVTLVVGDLLDGVLHLDALDSDLFSISSLAAFIGAFGFGGAEQALAAGSWRSRRWLGRPHELVDGAPADLLVFDADPRADLDELRRPRHVILRGVRVGPT